MRDKLTTPEEMSGILNWAIDGCLEWQKKGLAIPKEVTDATGEYRIELDSIHNFIEECIDKENNTATKSRYLYEAYTEWCEDNGAERKNQRMFGMRLRERGYEKEKRRDGIYWLGIRFRKQL